MENQKKFQKKSLNNNDYKAVERGAQNFKKTLGALSLVILVVKNKDKIKELRPGVMAIYETCKKIRGTFMDGNECVKVHKELFDQIEHFAAVEKELQEGRESLVLLHKKPLSAVSEFNTEKRMSI